MPYICLAQDGIADGTVNILDLFPNESQRNLIYDVVGQTRYVNRAQNEIPVFDANGQVLFTVRGLSAYLAARVEPAGTAYATGTVTVVGTLAGDTVTISNVVLTAVAGPADPTAQEFEDVATSGSAALSAASLLAAINDAATQALFDDGYAAQATIVGAVLTLTATIIGVEGDLSLATSAPARFTLSGTNLVRAGSVWTPANLAAASAAILTRVGSGLSLTETDIDTILSTYDAELTNTNTRSRGTVKGVLSILAGRGFTLPAGSVLLNGAEWVVEGQGSFSTDVTIFDPDTNTSPTGTVVQRENKPIRPTFEGGSLNLSLLLGDLQVFTSGVTLYPTTQRHTTADPAFPTVTNARLVTVYADDGTVLA